MKSKMKRKFTLRTGLLTALTVALIASAAVFIGASAAESVSPTDVVSASNTVPKHSVSHSVKQSGVSPSDVSASDVQASITVTREAEPDVKNVPNLGAPAITMTTSKAVGESISFFIEGSDIYIDYGDGTPVEYTGDGIVKSSVKSSEIKIYGNITKFYAGHLDHRYSNNLTHLDVSKATNLEMLDCENNQLSTLDVSNNTKLVFLNCMFNSLTTLDVSKNTALDGLWCDVNKLSVLDVSNNTVLTDLTCCDNRLKTIDLSNNTALVSLQCQVNYIPFSKLNEINATNYDDFEYAPQTLVIPSSVKAGEKIDLSSEYSIGGTVSSFTWYDSDGNTVTPTSSSGGVFTFGDNFVGKKFLCKMTNAKLPDFRTGTDTYDVYDDDGNVTGTESYDFDHRLTTTEVTIKEADPVSEPETVSDSDIPVNNNSFVDSAEYSNDIKVTVNGVEIDIKNVQLIVSDIETNKKISILDAIQKYAKSINITMRNTALCDISLVDNNKVHVKVEKGKIKICLKYPDNLARQSEKYTFRLYHQKDDGTIEEIPVVCKPDGIYFEATSFSPFALVWNEKSSTGSPGTGESSVVIWNMFILLMLSAAAGAIVIYRNRFAEAE